MRRLTCLVCRERIENGTALLRSRSLVQVAFHPRCYHPAPVPIPAQRAPEHDLAPRQFAQSA